MLVTTPRATTALSSTSAVDSVLMGEDESEPYLNPIPSGLFPEYRPLPLLSNVPLLLLAAVLGGGGVRRLWHTVAEPSVIPVIKFASRTLALYSSSYMAIQEAFERYRPSRISVPQLQERYHLLPSQLSRFERLTSDGQRIHWIQCTGIGDDVREQQQLDAAVLFHGFGANCLSWLPCFSALAQSLSIGTCVAHDSPGFGLTERGDDFSMEGSAKIGTDLLHSTARHKRNVLLIGHSLGAGATLRMALQLQDTADIEKIHVVLVSPVLGRQNEKAAAKVLSRQPRRRQNPFMATFGPILRFLLRRTVGRPGFWRKGLQQAFVKQLSASDVLRYQWPSVIQGWEDGLLQWISHSRPRNGSNVLEVVSQSPKVSSVSVILGSQDRVINPQTTAMFLAAYHPTVKVVEIDGVGHDPMEEDVGTFVAAVRESTTSS